MDAFLADQNLARADRLTDDVVLATTNLMRDRTPMSYRDPDGTLRNRVALVELQATLLGAPDAAIAVLAVLAQRIGVLIVTSRDDAFIAAALKRELTDDNIGNYFLMRSVAYAALVGGDDADNTALAKDKFDAAFDEISEKPVDEIVRGALTLSMRMSSIDLARQALEFGYIRNADATIAGLSTEFMGMG